jgi:ribosomal protein S10
MKYSMKILIRSFNPETLKNATEQIIEMRKFSPDVFAPKQSVVGFPTTTQKWTVLRSPHVDKNQESNFK